MAESKKDREPPVSPQDALRIMAIDSDKQTRALYDIADDLEIVADYIRKEKRNWHRMRLYIGIGFWLWIGIPLLLLFLFLLGGGFALFGS